MVVTTGALLVLYGLATRHFRYNILLHPGTSIEDCLQWVDDWAVEIIRRLDSYTERSPSGTGYHVIVYGSVPDDGNRRGGLEMYDSHRYFTVTGDRVPGAPKCVNHRAKQLRDIHKEYIAASGGGPATTPVKKRREVSIPDQDLLERAKNAANGRKFEALWNGDISGYDSHSEADQALCNILAFWTGGDPDRIERLFSRSGLVREKWRKRPDYRKRTIQNAIRSCSEFYEPPATD
jgi:primase-polymerase (primpol)-like protein